MAPPLLKAAILVLLTGCSLVWDPDSYVGPNDGGVVSADGGTDAAVDAPACSLTPMLAPITLAAGEVLNNVQVTVPEGHTGAAIIVEGGETTISNVRVSVDNAMDVITIGDVEQVTIENLEVKLAGEGALGRTHAIVATGTRSLSISNVLIDGLFALRFERVNVASVRNLAVLSAIGDSTAEDFDVVRIRDSEQVDIERFSIFGSSGGEEPRGVHISGSSDTTLAEGLLAMSSPVQRAAILIEDSRIGVIEGVDVLDAPAGLYLINSAGWDLDLRVKRGPACSEPTDHVVYARDTTDEISGNVLYDDECSIDTVVGVPVRAMRESFTPRDAVDPSFCFSR